MRFTPIEKLQAARATAVDRRARHGLEPRQGIVREPVHFVAFFEALHRVRAAADATRMARKKEAAMSVQKRAIRARPAVAFRALVPIGPQQFFEPFPVHANQALPASVARQYVGGSLPQHTPDLTLSRHLPDRMHRIAIMNALSFDAASPLKEKPKK